MIQSHHTWLAEGFVNFQKVERWITYNRWSTYPWKCVRSCVVYKGVRKGGLGL